MRHYLSRAIGFVLPLVAALGVGGCPIFPEEIYTPRTSHLMMTQEDRDIFIYVDPYYDFGEEARPRLYVGPVESIHFLGNSTFTYIGGEGGNMFRYDPRTFVQGDEITLALKPGESFWIEPDRKLRLQDILDGEVQLEGEESPRKFKQAFIVEDVVE